MHKSATKCNETLGKWCKNKHGASKIIDTFWTYQAPQAESHWRTDFKALVPAHNSTEIVMLKSHMERGLNMPPSSFFTNLLKFYGLQLHHIAPNCLVSVAGYAALCEGFLGICPRVDLFQLYFSVRANYEDDGFLQTCGTICFLPRRSIEYPFITPPRIRHRMERVLVLHGG
jgi:hypothetical protein